MRPDQEQAKRHKTRDYRYAYRGYHSESGICRVRVFEQTGKVPIIIVTELPENTNTSITNMCKYLACEIIRAHFPERFEEEEPVLWIEHYERAILRSETRWDWSIPWWSLRAGRRDRSGSVGEAASHWSAKLEACGA